MGGLSDLLMGVGRRAAQVSNRDEQRDYEEASAGRKLANEAILEKLKDPTLPYEVQRRYATQIEINSKMKPGTLSNIFDQAFQLHPHLEKLVSQGQQPMPPIPTMGADKTYSATPSTSMTFEPPVTIQGGGLKGQQAPAVAQPNVQMQGLPQFQQMAPMPQPPLGLNPRGVAQTSSGQAEDANAPGSEAERLQIAHHELVQKRIANLRALGAPQATIDDAIRASAGISPTVQAAGVAAQSRENVARISATARLLAAGNNSGNMITVQEPGEPLPKMVFEVKKGQQAGMLLEPNTLEPVQLKSGYKKLYEHPDQMALKDDTKGNTSLVNLTQGTVTPLGPIGKPGAATGTGTYRPLYDTAGNQIGWVSSKDPSDVKPMATPGTSATKPSEATQTKVDQLSTMTDQMNQLYQLIKMPTVQEHIGPVAGRVTDVARGFMSYPSEVNETYRIVSDLSDMLLRARSGAQINEQEYGRLRKIVPNPSTTIERFVSDLKGFTRELNTVLKRRGLPLIGQANTTDGIGKPPPPPIGTIIEGHRLKAYPSSDPNNWENVR